MNCVLFHSYIFCLRWLSWTDVLVQVRASSLLFASYEDCANQTSCTDMLLDDYQRLVFFLTNASTVWSSKVATLVLTNSFWPSGWKEHMFAKICCQAVIVWVDLSLWQPFYAFCSRCCCTMSLKLGLFIPLNFLSFVQESWLSCCAMEDCRSCPRWACLVRWPPFVTKPHVRINIGNDMIFKNESKHRKIPPI